jgi:hypothetical protein
MEQFEDGIEDHNVLARLTGEETFLTPEIELILRHFVENVFSHIEGKKIRAGRFLSSAWAEAHVLKHLDSVLTDVGVKKA